jgi:hypothetical protein
MLLLMAIFGPGSLVLFATGAISFSNVIIVVVVAIALGILLSQWRSA